MTRYLRFRREHRLLSRYLTGIVLWAIGIPLCFLPNEIPGSILTILGAIEIGTAFFMGLSPSDDDDK
jgi:hypothetical protein